MSSIELTRGDVFGIVITMMVCLTLGWCITFWILRHGDVNRLFFGGNILRRLTVILVVYATLVLVVVGVLNEAVCAIFSGIVGYVLGSMRRKIDDDGS